MNDYEQMVSAYENAGGTPSAFENSDVAHLVVSENRVLGAHLVPGLKMDVKETSEGIRAGIVIERGVKIAKPVHLCFGILPEEGLQKIDMDVEVQDGASVSILAHCVFPNAVKVRHLMQAQIKLGDHAAYEYHETHFHGENGGVEVIPKADISLGEHSRLKTTFSLYEGRAGRIDIDYGAHIGPFSVMEMLTKISAKADDSVKVREAGVLEGEEARGVLKSRIALRDQASGEVLNELTALGAGARGHVDCTEIIQDQASAKAVPLVDVRHPKAQVTHEAAIGGVNRTQLETLMARGLDEEEATEAIVQGLLEG